MTAHKREKLAATLMFLANKSEMPGIESRRHERLAGPTKIQQLTLTEGLSIACDIIDMSLSGASIGTPARPELGTMVKLGNLNARVVRHHDKGIALQFTDVQNPNAIRRYFG
jgi:PilZ domain